MKIKHGTTRIVIIASKRAYKFPTPFQWDHFLKGLLANMQEKLWTDRMPDSKICPVVFYIIGGFLVVMPRTYPLEREEYFSIDIEKDFWSIPVEDKLDSFGWLDDKIVAIDYGS